MTKFENDVAGNITTGYIKVQISLLKEISEFIWLGKAITTSTSHLWGASHCHDGSEINQKYKLSALPELC